MIHMRALPEAPKTNRRTDPANTKPRLSSMLSNFDIESPATATFSGLVGIPTRWGGFRTAVGIVVVHLVQLVLVTLLFASWARRIMGNNPWRTFSQVVSDDPNSDSSNSGDETRGVGEGV